MGLLFAFMVMALCATPSALSLRGSAVAVALPPQRLPQNLQDIQPVSPGHSPSIPPDHTYSPIRSPHGSGRKSHGEVLPPPNKPHHISSTKHHSPTKAAHSHDAMRPSSIASAPSSLSSFRGPTKKWVYGPASSPFIPFHRHHHVRNKSRNSGSGLAYPTPAPSNSQQGPSVPSFRSPLPSSSSWSSGAPATSPKATSGNLNVPSLRPTISPTGSSLKKMKTPPASSVMTLPPPPPNEYCGSVTCTEPLTYTPPGSPCGCVWPIQVKLALDVPIYTFFPLVSQLTEEIAASVGLNHSQVRVMGANAASQQLQKSTALINLVPLSVKFDDTIAFLIFKKFWQRQVFIKPSLFGAYEVLYVHYPGLPPSPPSHSSISTEDDGPYAGRDNKRQALKPLGVEVPMRKTGGLRGSMIAAIVLSSFTALVLCFGIAVFLLKRGAFRQPEQTPHDVICSPAKLSGATTTLRYGSMLSSSSASIDSCAVTYTGTAKTFTLNDIERATNGFDTSRIIGEGGFGVVYRGILDDGREVAVKVLKRANQHGGREFLAELEMLSRLHHRNLVKLFGVCIEDNNRCLVYELIHNGSLESHLHGRFIQGDDKVNGSLDWDARMKIALGAARGLAYLHEDSSPRVIHRDFKSSNILLEHDFTPKVSDFGLARTALDEGNKHISTHVMGTFGYLAPEYAMTGHLLVKSDVYSYGVVLLELLTGRKPVDLSQPPGQENLVAWARPLLTTKEGLKTIIDPDIESNISYDTLVKVAAIASMCVQPEVSHRPFMGEVVQALKLVCNEFDETKETIESRDLSEDCSISVNSKINRRSGELVEALEVCHTRSGYGVGHDNSMVISASEMITPMGLEGQESGSFRIHSSSGPLRSEGRRQFWQILKSSSRGSMREHGISSKFWPESH